MKPMIYAVNTSDQNVGALENVILNTIVRRYGCGVELNGSEVNLRCPGYYMTNINLTLEPTAIGEVAVALLVDGVEYPGATASVIATTAGEPYQVAFSAPVRAFCCHGATTLTVRLSAAATVTNAAVSVERM